ncbi:YccV-like domain-containing protein [Pimephales promelas]|nr:YccV-like domain-containing protein [Pimephales promelas]
MPQITSGVILQLTVLLSALPAQYLISRWTSGTAAQRHIATRRSFGEGEEQFPTLEEALAIEKLMHDNEQGYFGLSREVRSPRPAYVLHRVGQVIVETQNKMVGVIVGWDAGLRAPPEWIKRKKFSHSELDRAKDTPHYRILFSGPDSSSLLIGYIPQNNVNLLQGFEPEIPTLERYFSHFDGEKFVMDEWLKEIYPHD